MKKLLLTLSFAIMCFGTYAQNTFPSSGNVGIGTASPSSQLAIGGSNVNNPNNTAADIPYTSLTFQNQNSGNNFNIARITAIQEVGDYLDAGALAFSTGIAGLYERMRINTSGNVLIGKTSQANTAYILDVNGSVRANAITVNTTGADFVFAPSYKLLPLPTLKEYITQNHHLPEIASAKDMQANGLNVGDNQIKLLQKVEELTLYMIDKDKMLNNEKDLNTKQQQQIDLLNTKLSQADINSKIQSEQLKSQQEQLDQLKTQLNSILKQ
ncbi:hypothetical protein [Mucilaginibacter sp.]